MERIHYRVEIPVSARRNGHKPENLPGPKTPAQAVTLRTHSILNIEDWTQGFWDLGMESTAAGVELLELLDNPIWWGKDVPKGKGETVILIPGLLVGAYPSFVPMEHWLKRINYKPQPLLSTVFVNAAPIKTLAEDLLRTSQNEAKKSGQKVNIIGHSKGGYVALAALKFYPHECSQSIKHIVVMGSPTNPPIELNPFVDRLYRLNVEVGKIFWPYTNDFELMRELDGDLSFSVPSGLSLTQIESCQDGVIKGRGDSYFADDRYTVKGSHMGMVFNSEVYRIIGNRFAG